MNDNTTSEEVKTGDGSTLLLIFTRTPLHVGAGESVGAIDQPIQRERPTGFPVVPGSSVKGAIRATALAAWGKDKVERLFGKQEDAGRLAFGDARIVAFPVRSARGAFAFITCPLVLQRFKREYKDFSGLKIPDEPKELECLAGDTVTFGDKNGKGAVVLEEYRFARSEIFPSDWQEKLLGLLPDDPVWQAGKNRFVLLSDGDFGHFVRSSCEISQHVSIDPNTGTQKGKFLFNLEAVPAETLFFAPLTPTGRADRAMLDEFTKLVKERRVHQFGGDSTTGLGFCTLKLMGNL